MCDGKAACRMELASDFGPWGAEIMTPPAKTTDDATEKVMDESYYLDRAAGQRRYKDWGSKSPEFPSDTGRLDFSSLYTQMAFWSGSGTKGESRNQKDWDLSKILI